MLQRRALAGVPPAQALRAFTLCLVVAALVSAVSADCSDQENCHDCLSDPNCSFNSLDGERGSCVDSNKFMGSELNDQAGLVMSAVELAPRHLKPVEACAALANNRFVYEDFTKPPSNIHREFNQMPYSVQAMHDEILRLANADVRAVLKKFLMDRTDVPMAAAALRESVQDNSQFFSWKDYPPYLISFYGHYRTMLRGMGLSEYSANRIFRSTGWGVYWYGVGEVSSDGGSVTRGIEVANNPYFYSVQSLLTQTEHVAKFAADSVNSVFFKTKIPDTYQLPCPDSKDASSPAHREFSGSMDPANPRGGSLFPDLLAASTARPSSTGEARHVCCMTNNVPVTGLYMNHQAKWKLLQSWPCRVQREDMCAYPVPEGVCGGVESVLNAAPLAEVFNCVADANGEDDLNQRACLELHERIVLDRGWGSQHAAGSTERTEETRLFERNHAKSVALCKYSIKPGEFRMAWRDFKKDVMGGAVELAYQAGRPHAVKTMVEALLAKYEGEANAKTKQVYSDALKEAARATRAHGETIMAAHEQARLVVGGHTVTSGARDLNMMKADDATVVLEVPNVDADVAAKLHLHWQSVLPTGKAARKEAEEVGAMGNFVAKLMAAAR